MVDSKQQRRLNQIKTRVSFVTNTHPEHHLYHFVWGRIKSGKTTYIASGPNPIIFLAEPGHMTVRNVRRLQVFPIDKAGDYMPPRWKDAWDFLYYLRHVDHDRKTVGIDSMSGLVDLAMRFILKDEEARDELREPSTPTQPTWNRAKITLLEYIEELENVCQVKKMHLILTAHERQPREGDMEEAEVVPDLSPSVRRDLLKRPSIISRTFLQEDEESEEVLAYGMTFRDSELMVGERVTPVGAKEPWLPREAYNVTIPKLIRRIERKSSGNSQK